MASEPIRRNPISRRLVKGDHETSEGPYITAPHKSGDIFTHAYNGGGGYGDVLERDPARRHRMSRTAT